MHIIHTGVGVWTVWTVVTGGVGVFEAGAVTVAGVVVAVVIVAATVCTNKQILWNVLHLKS